MARKPSDTKKLNQLENFLNEAGDELTEEERNTIFGDDTDDDDEAGEVDDGLETDDGEDEFVPVKNRKNVRVTKVEDVEPDEDEDEESETDEDEDEKADEDEGEEDPDEEPEDGKTNRAGRDPIAERRLVAQKRYIRELQEENRRLKESSQSSQDAEEIATLSKRYAKTYDPAYARELAKRDVQSKRLAERVELMEFKDVNQAVLKKYPGAYDEADRVRGLATREKITVEQAARALFGTTSPDYVKRAKAAANGEIDESGDDESLMASRNVRASRTTGVKGTKGTARKNELEQKLRASGFPDDFKLTDDEYKSLYGK